MKKVTKRVIQKSTIGQLEDLLAELANVDTSEAAEQRHQIESRLDELEATA